MKHAESTTPLSRWNARKLRSLPPDPQLRKKISTHPIRIILDNVLDTYNVGAIFRLADAIAAERIYLCKDTETPPNPKIKKASVNTWQWVDWVKEKTAEDAIRSIKREKPNVTILAVEQHAGSMPLSALSVTFPVAVIVGNETSGVSAEALNRSDCIVELPMFGINTSLNVMVSCAVVLYKLLEIQGKQ